jgi:hypothetical protein
MVVRGAHDTRPEAGCAEDTRLIEWVIWAGEPGLGMQTDIVARHETTIAKARAAALESNGDTLTT